MLENFVILMPVLAIRVTMFKLFFHKKNKHNSRLRICDFLFLGAKCVTNVCIWMHQLAKLELNIVLPFHGVSSCCISGCKWSFLWSTEYLPLVVPIKLTTCNLYFSMRLLRCIEVVYTFNELLYTGFRNIHHWALYHVGDPSTYFNWITECCLFLYRQKYST